MNGSHNQTSCHLSPRHSASQRNSALACTWGSLPQTAGPSASCRIQIGHDSRCPAPWVIDYFPPPCSRADLTPRLSLPTRVQIPEDLLRVQRAGSPNKETEGKGVVDPFLCRGPEQSFKRMLCVESPVQRDSVSKARFCTTVPQTALKASRNRKFQAVGPSLGSTGLGGSGADVWATPLVRLRGGITPSLKISCWASSTTVKWPQE